MSTRLRYHAFGVRGYDYVNTAYTEGRVVFTLRQRPPTYRCSAGGARQVAPRGHQERTFHAVPLGGKPVAVVLPLPRGECPTGGVIRPVPLHFADPRRRYTRALERYARAWRRLMTIPEVAPHLPVRGDTSKDIQQRYREKRFRKPRLGKRQQIAIAASALGPGHRSLTVVWHLETGAVVFVGDGQGADAREPFGKRLQAARAPVEAVATDMAAASIQAVRDHLGEAVHVFDHCHVIQLFHAKRRDLRRELHRAATARMHQEVRPGTRWLLRKNPAHLDPKRKERARLEEALRMNQPLATVSYLQEDRRPIGDQPDKETAARVWDAWIRRAEASCIQMLPQFARTWALPRRGILASDDYPISTGPWEGTNNKIQTMKRQAYGFRDQEFFQRKILAIHEAKYALVG